MDIGNRGPWPILIRTLWISESDSQEANQEEVVYGDALVISESIQGTYSAYELRITYSVRKIKGSNSEENERLRRLMKYQHKEAYVLCRSHGFPDRPGLPPDCGVQYLRTHGRIDGVIRDLNTIFRGALENQRPRLSPEVAEIIEEENRNTRTSEMKAARLARREYRRRRARSQPTGSQEHGGSGIADHGGSGRGSEWIQPEE
jgi:hypothetical protein